MYRKTLMVVIGTALFGLSGVIGCEQEVAREEEIEIRDDGTVEREETVVTEEPDGDIRIEEEREVETP